MTYQADPITMQVIRYAMEQVADEMGRTLVRTSSPPPLSKKLLILAAPCLTGTATPLPRPTTRRCC